MVTKQDVANRAGVSTATVGRVLKQTGYVSEEAKLRVTEAIDALNYRPNRLASNLRKQTSNTIAVLVEDLLNPYYMGLVDSMVERANEIGYVVSLFGVKNREVDNILDDLLTNRVCAIVNLAMFTCDFAKYDVFIENGVKLIHCTDVVPDIQIDYRKGTTQALELFHSMGRKNVAFICGIEEWLHKNDERAKCYYDNLDRLSFSKDPRMVLCADYPKSNGADIGYRLCNELIASGVKFDAIFCLTDLMAMGAMYALDEQGLRIPEDVAVIGCDNIEYARFFRPSLTTIDVDKKTEGRGFVDIVTGNTKKVRVGTHLVVRNSAK